MKNSYLALFFGLMLFSSCSDYLGNLYSPNAVNTPMLGEKGEIKIVTGVERRIDTLAIWQNHFSWSPKDNLGIMGSFSYARKKQSDFIKLYQTRLELGAGYYKRLTYRNERNHFLYEFYGGGGYGRSRDWNRGLKSTNSNSFDRVWIYDKFDGQYLHAFIQGSTGFIIKSSDGKRVLELVPTTRLTFVDFFKINHTSDVRPISLENPELVTFEIIPTMRFGHRNYRLMLQGSFVIPIGEGSGEAYERFSSADNYVLDMYIFAGFEMAFGMKKQKKGRRRK